MGTLTEIIIFRQFAASILDFVWCLSSVCLSGVCKQEISPPVIGQNGSECFGRDEEFGELKLDFAHVCSVHKLVDSTSVHRLVQRMEYISV